MMFRWFLLVLSTALLITLPIMGQGVEAPGPKFDISEKEFDFGYIPNVCKVSHTYTLFSRGSEDLKIVNVRPACGCTKAPLEKEVIAPGDSTGLELILTSIASYRGTMRKATTVTSNDDRFGSMQIYFKATINSNPDSVGPIQLSQWDVAFTPENRSETVSINVRNVSQNAVKLSLQSLPHGYLQVVLPSTPISPGASAPIKVKIDPKSKATEFEKSFTFSVGDEANTRFTVPVVLAASKVGVTP